MKTLLTQEHVAVETGALRPHPLNAEIYRDEPDGEFVANVKDQGIIEPLISTTDNQIISGHRRWKAAQKAGLMEVPVRKVSVDTEEDKERLLLDSNRQREKSTEQKLREFAHYLCIESEGAKARQGRRSDLRTNLSTSGSGRARDAAAGKVGLSGTNAENGLKVLQEIDSRQGTEEASLAEQIRTVLNKESIHAAHAEILAAGWIKKVDRNPERTTPSLKSAPSPGVSQDTGAITATEAQPAPPADEPAHQPSVVKNDLAAC